MDTIQETAISGLEEGAAARDVTGTIIATSRISSIVRVTIDGSVNELLFSKDIFYTFGVKCEGCMDNILENEMEVNVCYKFSPALNKPYLIAVWLGNKPNELSDDSVLNVIYGHIGRVVQVDVENVLVQYETSTFLVLIKKRVLFRDGRPLEGTTFDIKIGDDITYDAIPLKREHNQYGDTSKVIFEASCGWIGAKEPRLVDRFCLHGTENELHKTLGLAKGEDYYGIVVAIPNDAVALVEVGCIGSKVMLFRTSFNESGRRMQDIVGIGEVLCVQVRLGHIFGGKSQLFAMQASRARVKIRACDKKNLSEETVSVFQIKSSSPGDKKSNIATLGNCSDIPKEKDCQNAQIDITLSVDCEPGANQMKKRTRTRKKKQRGSESGESSLPIEDPGLSNSVAKIEQSEERAVKDELPPAENLKAAVKVNQRDLEDGNELTPSTATPEDDFETGRIDELNSGTLSPPVEICLRPVEVAWSDRKADKWRTGENNDASIKAEDTGRKGNHSGESSLEDETTDKCGSTTADEEYEELENAASKRWADVETQGTLNLRAAKFSRDSPVLFSYPPLTGIISRFSFDSACVSYEDLKVFVDRKFMFVNGFLSTTEQFLNLIESGETTVNFEAVLKRNGGDVDVSRPTHDAVCVWVGEKPSLFTVLSSLPPADLSLADKPDATFAGAVRRLYLPYVAIISLIHDDKTSTVCLHVRALRSQEPRSDFASGMKNCIVDFVTLRDFVEFTVRRNAAHPQILEACRVSFIGTKRGYERKIKAEKDMLILSSMKRLPVPKNGGDVPSSPVLYRSAAFTRGRPSKRRSFLLSFLGTTPPEEKSFRGNVKINHALGHCFTAESTIIYGIDQNSTFNHTTGQIQEACQVRFDAEVVGSLSNAESIIVRRVWASDCRRPSPEHCLMSELSYKLSRTLFLRSRSYEGKITSIPFHDCAIAVVEDCKVLVPLDSLVLPEKLNPDYHTIDVFFSEGDVVSLRIAERKYQNGNDLKFLKAFECWKLVKYTADGLSKDLKVVTVEEELSWENVWGLGEYYRTSPLVKREGRLCVEFASSKRPGLNLRMDPWRQGIVYVDGKVTEATDEVDELLGRDITFHVAHTHPSKLMERTSYGMFINFSWIGKEPLVSDMLDSFVVGDLVNPDCWYEAFVDDFPLPTHALGKIGHVPVLIPLPRVEIDGKFVKADTSLRKRLRVMLRVQEFGIEEMDCKDKKKDSSVPRLVFVIARKVKQCPNVEDVLRNVLGTVVSLPRPTGKIKIDDVNIEVDFELCHVCCWEEGLLTELHRISWFCFLLENLQIGHRVTLTAVKENGKDSYRTLEVRLEKPLITNATQNQTLGLKSYD